MSRLTRRTPRQTELRTDSHRLLRLRDCTRLATLGLAALTLLASCYLGAWAGDAQAGPASTTSDRQPTNKRAVAARLNPDFLQWTTSRGLLTPKRTVDGRRLGLLPAPHALVTATSTQLDDSPTQSSPADDADAALAAGEALGPFPSSYDLRSLGRLSPIKDQGAHGTCWAFATNGSMESCLLPAEPRDFSEDHLVRTSGFDSVGDPYDQGGQLWMSTAYLTRWGGPVLESEDAYGDGYTPTGLRPNKHVHDVTWLPPRLSATDNDLIKQAVSENGAVYVAMSWQGSSAGSSYYHATNHAYYYGGSYDSNHAVLVVGWDDAYPAGNFATVPPGDGAFIVKNSWGTEWGESGYFYISYYDMKLARDTYAATFEGTQQTGDYDTVYQYDPLGEVSSLGYEYSDTGWMANRFTADTGSTLTAVGFYAEAPGTLYKVYWGPSLDQLSQVAEGTQETMGFHTVELPAGLWLEDGAQFVVAMQITTPGYEHPIAIEYPYPDYSSQATASAGQSFCSHDGVSWCDITDWQADTNVCLKAYTCDKTAPTTAISGLPSGWVRGPVTLTLSGSDEGCGVACTEYSLDGAAYVRGTTLTVTAEGQHALAYRSADNAGNVEPSSTAQVNIDRTGPRTVAVNRLRVRRNRKAVFRFSATDRTPTATFTIKIFRNSRLKKTLRVGKRPCATTQTRTWTRCALPKGTYTWKVYATDAAGNRQIRIGSNRLVVR